MFAVKNLDADSRLRQACLPASGDDVFEHPELIGDACQQVLRRSGSLSLQNGTPIYWASFSRYRASTERERRSDRH
jgi:hypothetical protein